MGLFISLDANILPNNASLDLIAIANMDTGYGETNLSASRTQVTYARTLGGVCQLRLDDLVNNGTYTSPPDIIIFAVDGSFLLSDGTPITSIAGIAIPVGNALNPTTSDVAAIYDTSDCNGNHWWVDQDGGGTTSFPSSVILYHELAHCFHFVTGVASTEPLAETDENDMRDQLGVTHRDVTSHTGGCGGTGFSCCIVASISSGSHHSTEVNQLRFLRDRILRRSEVGDDFFNRLHYDYYAFSPEVCSLMGNNSELSDMIKSFFVTPLVYTLELLAYYMNNKGKDLVKFLIHQMDIISEKKEFDLTLLNPMDDYLKFLLGENSVKKNEFSLPDWLIGTEGMDELFNYLNKEALGSEVIKWALIDSLFIWVKCCSVIKRGVNEKEFEMEVYDSISRWISGLPVTEVWSNFSRIETELELSTLSNYIFSKEGKTGFGERLMKSYPKYSETILKWSLI